MSCTCWNYNDILSTFNRHHCVRLYLCGHVHSGGHAIGGGGIHHVSLPGIIEIPTDRNAFGTVKCYSNRIDIVGQGDLQSLSIPL